MTVDELKKAIEAVNKTAMPGKQAYAEQLVEYFKIISKGAEEAVKPIKLPKKLKKKALADIGKHNEKLLKKVAEAELLNDMFSAEYQPISEAEMQKHSDAIVAAMKIPAEFLQDFKKPVNYGSSSSYYVYDYGSTSINSPYDYGVSGTHSPVGEWKKQYETLAKKQILMDPTVIALQTRVKELEEKLAKKELQESDLKEPKKRKRIVEI